MPQPFRLGINMAGAVSAGAYTAGVLDFLIEALDAWYAERARLQDKSPSLWGIPSHDVSLEVLSGASAGGMCAAISALVLQEQFDHVRSVPTSPNTAVNRLYECWVRRIDLEPLLATSDLKDDSAVHSLLDCKCIDEIAEFALQPNISRFKARPWVSKSLALYLTLTNLRGIPYSVDTSNHGSFEERILYHADEIAFGFGLDPLNQAGTLLPLSYPPKTTDAWSQLRLAAMATGAFPGALAARTLKRKTSYYENKFWTISNPHAAGSADCQCQVEKIIPIDWGISPAPAEIDEVYVDGGVTNNNPFECARTHLVRLAGGGADDHNPREAQAANAAVLSVAPFPGMASFDQAYNARVQSSMVNALGSLLSVFLAQSRFQGESLSLVRDPDVHSRFAIAPSDDASPQLPSLLCAALGAFGGFIDRKFRERDYQLGRRNCQRFLEVHFLLPKDNSIIGPGLIKTDPAAQEKLNSFRMAAPPGVTQDTDKEWFPIIPLMPSVRTEAIVPARTEFKTTTARLEDVSGLATQRIEAVAHAFINTPRPHPLRDLLLEVFVALGHAKVRGLIENYLTEQLRQTEQV